MIYLVRHGETELNKQRKFYGTLDVSINQTGVEQAKAVGKKLASVDFDTIFVSGLKRTRETAELIRGEKCTSIVECASLNEKSFGLWEGLDADQIEALYPCEWQDWLTKPFEVTPPEAEKFSEFKRRVIKEFVQIMTEKRYNVQRPILFVGHLGVLRVINHYLEPKSEFWAFDVPQGEYVIISSRTMMRKLV